MCALCSHCQNTHQLGCSSTSPHQDRIISSRLPIKPKHTARVNSKAGGGISISLYRNINMKPESQTLIGNIYCSLLKRMQLSCTACLQSHNTQDDSRATTCRCCHKHEFLSLHGLSIGSHLLGISFITNLRSNLRTALTTQNTTENNSIISHAQKKKKDCTSAKCIFKCTTSVTGHKQGTGDFTQRKKNCQGPLKTPHSVSVRSLLAI